MSDRIYFKKVVTKNEHFNFCKQNGATYFEEERGIWIISKKYGEFRIAIGLQKDGASCFGKINESCDNFEKMADFETICNEEQKWIIETLTNISKYKPENSDKK